MKTVVIPVVVGALGTVKKGMVENIKKVSERATMTEIQKDLHAGICTNPQKGGLRPADAQKEHQQKL